MSKAKELDDIVRDRLLAARPQWQAIATKTGVSYDWMRKFITGKIPNPGINTLRKIRDYFKGAK